MLVIYKNIPEDELRASAQETITKIETWFEQNPRRRVCNAELWYGRQHKIKRKNVADQINDIVDAHVEKGEVA